MEKQISKQQVQQKWNIIKIMGWIQLSLGIILIIASVVSIWYIPGKMIDLQQKVGHMSTDYMEATGIESNSTTGQIFTQELITRSLLGLEHLILFGLLETILIVLSIILIMQGIVNIKE